MRLLIAVVLVFLMTVPCMAKEIPNADNPPGVITDDLVHRYPTETIEQDENGNLGLVQQLEPETVKEIVEAEVVKPIVDLDGELISLERTNQLIELRKKLEQNIQILTEHINFLDAMINKRDDEIKQNEILFLREQRKVELLTQKPKK